MLDCGYGCEVKESDSFVNIDALHQYLVEKHISCILGIHAVRAGKLLQGLCIDILNFVIHYVKTNCTGISSLLTNDTCNCKVN